MDLVISQESDYFQKNQKCSGPLHICFGDRSDFKESMATVRDVLYENEYYGFYKSLLMKPLQLFDKYRTFQQWGGSPGVENGFLGEFSDQTVYDCVVFENIKSDEKKIDVQQQQQQGFTVIQFVFPTAQLFDQFTDTLVQCMSPKVILDGVTSRPISYSVNGFVVT